MYGCQANLAFVNTVHNLAIEPPRKINCQVKIQTLPPNRDETMLYFGTQSWIP